MTNPLYSSSAPNTNKRAPASLSTYPTTTSRHRLESNHSFPQSSSMAGPTHRQTENMQTSSRTNNTASFGYRLIIDKARTTQKEIAEHQYNIAKTRHQEKMKKAKDGRLRADESALRLATVSSAKIDEHYKELLVDIKANMRARLEAELIAEVREDVYRRYPEISSEYEAEIRDETYTFLVDSLEPIVRAALHEKLEDQVKEELRQEMKAEVKAELRAQYEVEREEEVRQSNSKGQQHPYSAPPQVQIHNENGTVDTINSKINDLDSRLAQEVEDLVREVAQGVDQPQRNFDYDAQVQGPESTRFNKLEYNGANALSQTLREEQIYERLQGPPSPFLESIEIKEEKHFAAPYDRDHHNQTNSRSGSVSSKRSWSGSDEYEEEGSPSKRQRYSPHDKVETFEGRYDDDDDSFHGPLTDESDFADEESVDPDTPAPFDRIQRPGPFGQLAPPLGQLFQPYSAPGPVISKSNTAADPFVIDISDGEDLVQVQFDGEETIVEAGFAGSNSAGYEEKSELFINSDNDEEV